MGGNMKATQEQIESLIRIADTQAAFWDALSAAESALGVELDSTVDYIDITAADATAWIEDYLSDEAMQARFESESE
jgi:hypothetical protein